MSYTLWRDDDISVYSSVYLLEKVNNLFKKYNKIHTVAVEMNRLWENKEVWFYILDQKNIQIGLHGWEHFDYSKRPYPLIMEDFDRSLNYWEDNVIRGFGKQTFANKQIKKFFPPWNRVSEDLRQACKDKGLELDDRVGGEVYNFHYWIATNEEKLKNLEINLQRE